MRPRRRAGVRVGIGPCCKGLRCPLPLSAAAPGLAEPRGRRWHQNPQRCCVKVAQNTGEPPPPTAYSTRMASAWCVEQNRCVFAAVHWRRPFLTHPSAPLFAFLLRLALSYRCVCLLPAAIRLHPPQALPAQYGKANQPGGTLQRSLRPCFPPRIRYRRPCDARTVISAGFCKSRPCFSASSPTHHPVFTYGFVALCNMCRGTIQARMHMRYAQQVLPALFLSPRSTLYSTVVHSEHIQRKWAEPDSWQSNRVITGRRRDHESQTSVTLPQPGKISATGLTSTTCSEKVAGFDMKRLAVFGDSMEKPRAAKSAPCSCRQVQGGFLLIPRQWRGLSFSCCGLKPLQVVARPQ